MLEQEQLGWCQQVVVGKKGVQGPFGKHQGVAQELSCDRHHTKEIREEHGSVQKEPIQKDRHRN